jgi:plasmid stabilization system protein ParE
VNLVWARLASADRNKIREYIAQDNPAAALVLDEAPVTRRQAVAASRIVMKTYTLSHYHSTRGSMMSKQAVFTMKLEPELRAEFMAAAEVAHRPASQVMRELMREFVQRQSEAREYDEFLRRKVEVARLSKAAGLGRSNDEVEADFATRRTRDASQV